MDFLRGVCRGRVEEDCLRSFAGRFVVVAVLGWTSSGSTSS